VTVKPGTAPSRCYVGRIQAIDSLAIRLTQVDWIIADAASWDFYVPHSSVESALVATEEHNLKAFGDVAGKWQEAMNKTNAEDVK
jgi:hypothetical protein